MADKLNDAGQGDKADQVQKSIDDTKDAVRSKWRATKDQYLEVCNQKMVGKYVTAALIARKYNVKDAAVQNARRAARVLHRLPRRRQDEAVRREHARPARPEQQARVRQRRVLAVAVRRRDDAPGQRRSRRRCRRRRDGRAGERQDHARPIHGVALALAAAARRLGGGRCGGSAPAAKTPDGDATARAIPRRRPSTRQGQQVGIAAAPGAADDELTGAAKDAYDRGFQAWVTGDLAGAKTRLQRRDRQGAEGGGPAVLARLRARAPRRHAGGARRVPRGVHGERASTRPRSAPTRFSSRAPATVRTPSRSSRASGAEPGLRAADDVPRRGEVDRGRQPRRPAARAAGARQAAGLQGRDDRHRARLLPRPPVGSREVRAAGDPRRRRRRLDSRRATRTTPRRS